MRRRGYAEEYLLWLLIFDLLAAAAGLLAAYLFRFELRIVPGGDGWRTILPLDKGWNPGDYLRIWPVAVVCWGLALAQSHAYRVGAPVFDFTVARRIAVGSIVAMAMVIAYDFFFRASLFPYSRYMPALAVAFVVAFLLVERWLFDRVLRAIAGRQLDHVLILGAGPAALRLARAIRAELRHGMVLDGFVTDNIEEVGARVEGWDGPPEDAPRCIGHIDALSDVLRQTKVQQLIIAHPGLPSERVAQLALECERAIVECRIVPGLLGAIVSDTAVQNVGGALLFGLRRSPLRGWNAVLKRVFDVVVSGALLLLLAPLMALIALLVILDSRGSVFYKQQRMGLDGRRFNLYKFRSMRSDAEPQGAPAWTAKDDPRRTRTGAVLRRFNLDELPQLFNVLRGDMSLVGPRPERPHFVKKFRDEVPGYMLRHHAKCGMTGWAQVNGLRGDSSIEDRIAYDLYYIENWSFWFDLKILLMTCFALRNAY